MNNMNLPIYFEISTPEQLDILHCAVSEFKDGDKETQQQADILTTRLNVLRLQNIDNEPSTSV